MATPKRRYEYHEDTGTARGSHKFWEFYPSSGGDTYVKWGRCGTDGQGKWFPTNMVEIREREKIRDGYRLVEEMGVREALPVVKTAEHGLLTGIRRKLTL